MINETFLVLFPNAFKEAKILETFIRNDMTIYSFIGCDELNEFLVNYRNEDPSFVLRNIVKLKEMALDKLRLGLIVYFKTAKALYTNCAEALISQQDTLKGMAKVGGKYITYNSTKYTKTLT
jgi:hypothetical protein